MSTRKDLTSTQRLPMIGRENTGILFLCNKCHNHLSIPKGFSLGHIRCRFCTKLHRVGIPPEYIRIHCKCGKILTALKQQNKKGICPGCHKVWQITEKEGIKVAIDVSLDYRILRCECKKQLLVAHSFSGKGFCPHCKKSFHCQAQKREKKTEHVIIAPIHFTCSCKQKHIVEAEKAGSIILCFQCHKEVIVPQVSEKSSDFSEVELWHLQSPYQNENFFSLLQISAESTTKEIKKACRKLQAQTDRLSKSFQKLQQAKDILTNINKRITYEITSGIVDSCWAGEYPLYKKALTFHQQAIQYELIFSYRKADGFWKKAICAWTDIVKQDTLWKMASERGKQLFPGKFREDIVEEIRSSLLHKIIISVTSQFYDRYIAKKEPARAHQHICFILDTLIFILNRNPEQRENQRILIDFFIAHIEYLAENQKLKKCAKALLDFYHLFPANREVMDFIKDFFPLLSKVLSLKKQRQLLSEIDFLTP